MNSWYTLSAGFVINKLPQRTKKQKKINGNILYAKNDLLQKKIINSSVIHLKYSSNVRFFKRNINLNFLMTLNHFVYLEG